MVPKVAIWVALARIWTAAVSASVSPVICAEKALSSSESQRRR
jgi:hypothetical protein